MPNCQPVSRAPRFAFTRAGWLPVLLLAVPALLGAGSARGQSLTWTIPGISNAAGLNGTRFVSDVALTNPGASPASVTLAFFGPGGLPVRTIAVPAGATTAYRNLLDSVWGAQGSGATQVTSDLPLLIRARTYNTASSGTYGVALPVFADERLLDFGETAQSLWISQSPDIASGYRTNVAVMFPDEGGGSAAVTIYDANGTARGSKDYSLDAPGFQQFSVSSFAGAVPVGRAEVVVTRGRAAGYSVVNDNVTGDGSLFTFEDLPAGSQDILVNGVARIDGNLGTYFRTDGRFYNPGTDDAAVSVAFHASLNANPAPLTRTFTVPAGRILDVVDVLDSLLGLPKGSAGALRFRSDGPVAILCRTSNVDPAGLRPGTFGAQQKSVPLLSFLMSADGGGVVTGIRQNTTFRTNIGFAAGEDGAAYTLTLKSASGATVATKADSLGPFGWKQPSIQVLFPGVTIPDDATLQVKVTSGSVDVFDSSLDNASGDSVVTPIMPLPVAIPSTATIGPAGGSIQSSDGMLTLKIPAGALAAATPVSLTVTGNQAPGALGAAYSLSPNGLSFAKPATLSLRYGTDVVPVDEIGGVSLGVLTGAGWAGLTGGKIDTSSRLLLIRLQSTSPAEASAAARTPLATQESTEIAVDRGLEVRKPVWLPTDGEWTLEVVYHTRPSSKGPEFTYELVGTRNVKVKWFIPKLGGTFDRDDLPSATYKAPKRIPAVWSALTGWVRVTLNDTDIFSREYKFYLIRRHWRLDVSTFVHLPCSSGSFISLELGGDGNSTYNTYSFSDDLVVNVNSRPTGLPPPKNPAIASCRSSCKNATITGDTGPVLLGGLLKASFLGARGFSLSGTVSQVNALPPYTEECKSPDTGGVDEGTPLFLPVFLAPGNSNNWPLSNDPTLVRTDVLVGVVLQWKWRSVDGDF